MAKKPAIDAYQRSYCKGCCVCEGGADNIKRNIVLWTLGICTCGFGLLVLPFNKKCTKCGHNTFMNKHGEYAHTSSTPNGEKKEGFFSKIAKWFKGLSSGKKIVVIVGVVVFCLFCVVVSGDTDKNTQQPAQPTETTQKSDDQKKHEEDLRVAFNKCVLMEVADINATPDAGYQDANYTKSQAISSATSFCSDYKTQYGEDSLINDTEIDWKTKKDTTVLDRPLSYWLENYSDFEQTYKNAFN